MNIEKRGSDTPEESAAKAPVPAEQKPVTGKKPVVVYIMILFIAAFLLMALSFLMHQRSNSEVLGEFQNSVSALQEMQAAQDRNMQLQEALSQAQDEIDALKVSLDQAALDTANAQMTTEALLSLYTLQQQYSASEFDACRQTLQAMEDLKQVDLLPTGAPNGVTSPRQRYDQLREAVINQ